MMMIICEERKKETENRVWLCEVLFLFVSPVYPSHVPRVFWIIKFSSRLNDQINTIPIKQSSATHKHAFLYFKEAAQQFWQYSSFSSFFFLNFIVA